MNKRNKRNMSSVSGKLIVWMFVLAAAGISARDIVSLFERIGVPAPYAFLAPVFIDGVTWLGKLMRSHELTERTNKLGLKYLVLGGGASLAANLTAGETLGWKLLGLLAVVGFILGEIALDHIEAREIVAEVSPAELAAAELAAKRTESALKGAATRAANKANGVRKPRKRRASPTNPVSPAAGPTVVDAKTVDAINAIAA